MQFSFYSLGQWLGWKVRNCGSKLKRKKFMKKKLKSLGAFPRGEVHNREEGEIGWKGREEGEIGWKSGEEGEIGWKSGEEGDLPFCTSPFFLYLHSHWKLNDWKTPVSFMKLSFEQYFAFKHAAEGQYVEIISFEAFYSRSVSDQNPICLGCDRVKKNSMAREKRGEVSSP